MFEDTPLIIVDDDDALARTAEELRGAGVLGVDTESNSFHHYRERVCLVQVSDLRRDYIIDPLALTSLEPLRAVLEDPSVPKVLHGADYDVVSLKRDFGIGVRNVFDTMIAARFLGMPRVGLADLVEEFFGHRIDKKYQRHDWSKRPLLPEHLEYARGDTHFLPPLRDILVRRLDRVGRLEAALEESRLVEEREWTGRERHPSDFRRVRGAGTLDEEGLRVLHAVWTYREEQARRMDRPAFRVIPDRLLLELARERPTTREAIERLARPRSPLLRRHGPALLDAVRRGLEGTEPLPEPPPPPERTSPRPPSPTAQLLLEPLRAWRNAYVERHRLDPVVVASNQLLREIARAAPRTREELARIDGIRRWQVDLLGDEILEVVAGVLGEAERRREGRKRRRRRRRRSAPAAEGVATAGEAS